MLRLPRLAAERESVSNARNSPWRVVHNAIRLFTRKSGCVLRATVPWVSRRRARSSVVATPPVVEVGVTDGVAPLLDDVLHRDRKGQERVEHVRRQALGA